MRVPAFHKLAVGIVFSQLAQMAVCQNDKPNIIFLLSDDQRDNTFSAMGHSTIKTPNADELINNGIWFTNTYIAEPVSSPSRTSLLTGMHERIHGVGFSSSYQLTEEQWSLTYPAILRDHGYYTGFIGKFGVEYYTFYGEANGKFDFWYAHDGWTKFFPKDYDYSSCFPYHEAENDIITPIIGEGIEAFVHSLPDDKAFCLSVSFNVPHGSQVTSMYTGYEGWFDMLRPASENPKLFNHPVYSMLYRDLDPGIPEDMGSDPYKHIPECILNQDSGRNKTYSYDYNRKSCTEHHYRYYQTITGMDKVIGDMVKTLKEEGLFDNTIIIFASDHGLLMGEYGMGGKSLLYDLTSKIPCFIFDPRSDDSRKGIKIDKLVSSLDIPVTILDLAGLSAPAEMTGKSLVPLMKGEETAWRKELFLESLFTLRDNPFCEGIRTDEWKYIRMYQGITPYTEEDLRFEGSDPDFEQLFYLPDDKEEKNNLIYNPEYHSVAELLRKKTAEYSANINKQRSEYARTHNISTR